MNALIVLAAGQGKRMGRQTPKMLIPVLGKPLLYWCLKNLEKAKCVDAIIVASPPGYETKFRQYFRKWHFKKVIAVVPGGKERQDSTANALKALPKEYILVGIHDGARPFVSHSELEKCFDAAEKSGAAILAVPSKDTIKVVESFPFVTRTVPRQQCWAAQTPQIFERELAEKLHFGSSRSKNRVYTDDASMAESLKIPVEIVESCYENLKVTTPEDLILMEAILRRKRWV